MLVLGSQKRCHDGGEHVSLRLDGAWSHSHLQTNRDCQASGAGPLNKPFKCTGNTTELNEEQGRVKPRILPLETFEPCLHLYVTSCKTKPQYLPSLNHSLFLSIFLQWFILFSPLADPSF